MTLGFEDVLNGDPQRFATIAVRWDELAATVAAQREQWQAQVHGALGEQKWQGAAADLARGHIDTVGQSFAGHEQNLRQVSAVLRRSATGFADAQAALDEVRQQAANLGLVIGQDGSVAVDPAQALTAPPNPQAMQDVANRIGTAIQSANTADQQAASALDALAPGGPGTAPLTSPSSTTAPSPQAAVSKDLPPGAPAPGSDPKAVKQWWDTLSLDEKRRTADKYPYYVGSTNGIPSAARDYANRQVLDDLIANTKDEEKRKGLLKLRQNLGPGPGFPEKDIPDPGDPQHPPKLLLNVNTDGTGHMIVATGNPDSAHNVVTWVPGMGTKLNEQNADWATGIPGNIYNQTVGKDHGGSTAVIAWMDYDAPPDVGGAAFADQAKAAAPHLADFERGLNATHNPGDDPHSVLLGHSYGSSVVGETANALHGQGGLSALGVDDVIAVGSPGMDVWNAKDLGVKDGHVFASRAALDPIALSMNQMGVGAHLLDPTDPKFGAHVFDSGTGGNPQDAHGSYFVSTESLTNMSDIIRGDYGKVH
ncbi:alpha/beta hydrolase [Actinocrispum sp. NPDC049592]|uniref:alpha/beta hydrolase n=1 Tax=Actinocrispum sp. NPDC049592 TaxID=3154835 RepID=UPI003425748B